MQQDYPAAEKWLLQAAKRGHGQAQIRLGFLYGENHFPGIETNLGTAEYWLIQAADQDAVHAKFRLGNFYQNYLKPPDYPKAEHWLKRASDEDNDGSAQYDLARLYMSEYLAAPDLPQAEKYLTAAAPNNIRQAQIELVRFYEDQTQFDKALYWADHLSKSKTAARYWKGKTEMLKNRIE